MPATPHPDPALLTSLQDSRSRWRALALLEATLVFELDPGGRISFLAPDEVLGQDSAALLGQPAEALLGIAPDCIEQRGVRAWARWSDGTACCLEITATPLPQGGLRGVARDVTAAEREAEIAARALRRATTLGRLLRLGTRQRGAEAGAASALAAMLGALPAALPAQGVALLRPCAEGWLTLAGSHPPNPASDPRHALAQSSMGIALFAWRDADAPPFEREEHDLLAALAMPAAALEAEATRQATLDAAARRDSLTGLLNRFGFEQSLTARLAGRATGCLVFTDLDGLKVLNDQHGHEAGDAALRCMANRLRALAGPADLAARLGGDEFCLWLDGHTMPTAAAHVATLGTPGPLPDLPQFGPAALRASVGLVDRREGEAMAALVARADAAMYVVKHRNREARAA